MDFSVKQPNSEEGTGNGPVQSAAQPAHSSFAKPTDKKARKGGKLFKNKKLWAVLLILLVLAASAGTAVYYAQKNSKAQKEVARLSNPQEAAKAEQEALIAKVGMLTNLPAGETPTVATVSDASKLKSQAFFAEAQNGDKVLIYTKEKRAYLYRPSTDKIINIAPVNIGAGANSSGTGQ